MARGGPGDVGQVEVPDLVGMIVSEARRNGHEAGLVVVSVDPDGPVPLEYSIERLTCTAVRSLEAVMVGLAGADQDRLHAGLANTQPGRRAVPRRPGGSGRGAGAPAWEPRAAP